MTKTKIVALLSVLALLASLPLTVVLAQAAPYLVIGTAMLDDEPAMMGTMVVAMVGDEKVGSGEVFDDMGHYRLQITGGSQGDTVMIYLIMGEGDEAMEYLAMTDEDVMIGAGGEFQDGRPDGLQRCGGAPTRYCHALLPRARGRSADYAQCDGHDGNPAQPGHYYRTEGLWHARNHRGFRH